MRLDENDFEGYSELTKLLGKNIQIVGDDFFATNLKRLQKGIDKGAANSILIKLNQIGTLTETIDAINLAKNNNYGTIISHRSGETEEMTCGSSGMRGLCKATKASSAVSGAKALSSRPGLPTALVPA